jgi:hypothetical protein
VPSQGRQVEGIGEALTGEVEEAIVELTVEQQGRGAVHEAEACPADGAVHRTAVLLDDLHRAVGEALGAADGLVDPVHVELALEDDGQAPEVLVDGAESDQRGGVQVLPRVEPVALLEDVPLGLELGPQVLGAPGHEGGQLLEEGWAHLRAQDHLDSVGAFLCRVAGGGVSPAGTRGGRGRRARRRRRCGGLGRRGRCRRGRRRSGLRRLGGGGAGVLRRGRLAAIGQGLGSGRGRGILGPGHRRQGGPDEEAKHEGEQSQGGPPSTGREPHPARWDKAKPGPRAPARLAA